MWSVGVIIYYLISGVHPFRGATKDDLFLKIQTCDYEFSPDRTWDDVSE